MMKKYFISHNKEISVAYIWIEGGSNLDETDKKGINQILCSLLTRGCKSFNKYELSNLFDSYGAELNIETLEDGISIGIKSLNEYFDNVYPLLDLILNCPNLEEKEFLQCKNNQISFLEKLNENLFSKTFDNWRKIVYKNHPYAFETNGYIEHIKNINYRDILNEYNNFQKRKKYLLSNHKLENHLNIHEDNFVNTRSMDLIKNSKYSNNKNRFIDSNLSSNQLIIMIGNETCNHNHEDFLALKVLESHLSFGMSSVLFDLFREQNGLSYDVGIFNPIRKQNAPFLIYLSVSSKKAIFALKLLLNLWKNILKNKIDYEGIKLAKIKLRNSILTNNQTIEDIVLRKIQLIGFKMNPNFDNQNLEKLKEINSEKILEVSKKYFEHPYLSVLGEKKICDEIYKVWESFN